MALLAHAGSAIRLYNFNMKIKTLALLLILAPLCLQSTGGAQTLCNDEDLKKQNLWAQEKEKAFISALPPAAIFPSSPYASIDLDKLVAAQKRNEKGLKPALDLRALELRGEEDSSWRGAVEYGPCLKRAGDEVSIHLSNPGVSEALKVLSADVTHGNVKSSYSPAHLNAEEDGLTIIFPNTDSKSYPGVLAFRYLLRQQGRNALLLKVEALGYEGKTSALLGYGSLSNFGLASKLCTAKALAQYLVKPDSFPPKEPQGCSN